ncbi:hypothetical protein L204_102076 [Cryptococcus depauperatus]
MGNCFSDPSASSKTRGNGQALGSAPSTVTQPTHPVHSQSKKPSGRLSSPPPQTLGNSFGDESGDPRERALRAAEERAKASANKGVHSSNTKAGQLSSKLAAERRQGNGPQQTPDERMMDAGQWN